MGGYKEAIAAASQALESLPVVPTLFKVELFVMIQHANLRLANQEAGLEATLKAWESDPDSIHAAFNMFYTFHHTGRHSKLVETVRTLLTEPRWGPSFLGRIMRAHPYISEYISNACAETGQIDLARDTFMKVSAGATDPGNIPERTLADATLAMLYNQYYRDENEAIKMWKSIVEDYPGTGGAIDASYALASLYFTNAADSAVEGAESWISELERLAERWELQRNLAYRMGRPAEGILALAGRWYAQRGKGDLARARTLPLVKLAIRDLTDRFGGNDHAAYCDLRGALLCFGDRRNAEIASAFTVPLRKFKERLEFEASVNDTNHTETKPFEQEEENNEDEEPLRFIGSCEGNCTQRDVDFKSFSTCEICFNTGFCDQCLQKLKNGEFPFRVCNPKHPFFELYPPKGLVTKGAKGFMVKIDDERIVSADEWLGSITRDWLGE